MNVEESGRTAQPLSMTPPCAHNRLISDCVSEEEHNAGKVCCVECGSVILDPHRQWNAEGT
jgi:hypothetical protein